jgi:hypothetical protein
MGMTGYTLVFLSILSSAFLRQLVRRFGARSSRFTRGAH